MQSVGVQFHDSDDDNVILNMTRTITIEWPWVGHNRTQTSSILLSTITEAQHICFRMMRIIFILMKTKMFIIIV